MCTICLQFNKWRDVQDARLMISRARTDREILISEEHLEDVEKIINGFEQMTTQEGEEK